ncbi:MAG: pyrimidine-specific ribonucleoside hydrolase RihA [Acidimicrobiales bacterium]|nr:pyrimidine-specific ribonucleoside hydrolase RihA [Acidimicrobiales bacterium]
MDILLDCDPGLDDAVAIAVAARFSNLLAVTTVGGNVGLDHTTANALAVLDLLGRPDVPVHSGHDETIRGDIPIRATEFHGRTGTGSIELPRSVRAPDSLDAVGFLAKTIRSHDGVQPLWLVASGPLTNVAYLASSAPDAFAKLDGISWMGGSATYGNATPGAEFNAFTDPEAAQIVFAAGHSNLIMSGLHLTHTVLLDRLWIDRFTAEVAGSSTAVFAEMLDYYERSQRAVTTIAGAAVHDAVAVAVATHPQLFEAQRYAVEVMTDSGAARGMTLVDRRPYRVKAPANCSVVDAADGAALAALIWESLLPPGIH